MEGEGVGGGEGWWWGVGWWFEVGGLRLVVEG